MSDGPLVKAARAAAEAHTNLTMFASVVSLLDGGHIYGPPPASVQTIIRLCHREQQRYLRAYDEAIAKLASKTP